jgi:SAM-dependent methyltransferase
MKSKKIKINVVRVRPPEYPHYRVFDEVVESLVKSLIDLGYDADATFNKIHAKSVNIMIGAHMLPDQDLRNLPDNVIIYNFEQFSNQTSFMREAYVQAMATHGTLDYSLKNIEELTSRYPDAKVAHVKLGYHKCLTKIQNRDKDIDVLFYGGISERRDKILTELEDKGIKVERAFNVYGKERDDLIKRSKVVLNMHQHEDTQILETVRVSYLMANSKAVVCERQESTEIPDELASGLTFAMYEDLVDMCLYLLDRDTLVEEEESAFKAITSLPYTDVLKDIDFESLISEAKTLEKPVFISKSLDLGCGPTPRNPYNATEAYGVDINDVGFDFVKQADLAIEPIPFETSSMDFITAFDFIEHVPRLVYINGQRRSSFIELMNEIYRVLKPGGIFRAHTPAYPHPEAFIDPTHVNYITEGTVRYFCENSGLTEFGKMYGFNGRFQAQVVEWDKTYKFHLVWELRAIK